MDSAQSLDLSINLMETAGTAILTTIGEDGIPSTRAMLNLRNRLQYPGLVPVFAEQESSFAVYFTTNTSSQKIRQIERNPLASVYYCRPEEWIGLTLGGQVEIVTDPDCKNRIWQPGWELYYPAGPQDPDYAVLRLIPSTAKLYYELQTHDLTL